jgi:hypothetical protein
MHTSLFIKIALWYNVFMSKNELKKEIDSLVEIGKVEWKNMLYRGYLRGLSQEMKSNKLSCMV